MDKGAKKRLRAAQAKVKQLLKTPGVRFNPRGVSDFTREQAASRVRHAGGQATAASIRSGASGTARVTKDGSSIRFR